MIPRDPEAIASMVPPVLRLTPDQWAACYPWCDRLRRRAGDRVWLTHGELADAAARVILAAPDQLAARDPWSVRMCAASLRMHIQTPAEEITRAVEVSLAFTIYTGPWSCAALRRLREETR